MPPDPMLELGPRWHAWPLFGVRGAGFPADGVLRLTPEGVAADSDKFEPGTRLAGPEWAAFAERFADAAVDTARELRAIAADPAFRTAVAWQNRALIGRAIDPVAAWEPTASGRTSARRQREELVAQYWQRFCVKNDTIGFFGPVGWGRVDLVDDGLAVDQGRGLTARTEVFFAGWALDALAKVIAADPRLRTWVAPRRVPFVVLGQDSVTVPGATPVPISPLVRRVLGLCDGVRPARDIAALVTEVSDMTGLLTDLQTRRWIVWQLELPADPRPERVLRAWLDRTGDTAARADGLALLDRLEKGRAAVAAADGPEALAAALAALETEFTELTDTVAARTSGVKTAPGRALVYADSLRSATVRAGRAVTDALAPLDPLLTSASWLTGELAARVMAGARPVYERLAARGPVDLASFWFGCMPVLHGQAGTAAQEVRAEFQRRWSRVLGSIGDARRVRRDGADIAARVRAEFAGRSGGWTAAARCSPDVLIAATSAAAVARGDFELVLGELHLATNTLGAALYVNQHPDPAELFARTDADHPGPRLLPVLPKEHRSRLSTRVRYALGRAIDYHVSLVERTVDPARPRAFDSADTAVVDRGGELAVVLPDGAEFPAVDVFAHVLTTLAMDLFQILPDAEHTPRVTVDRMVVARETWRVPVRDLAFAEEPTEAGRFVRARWWRAELDLPRFVFVGSPVEPRPFYVDFDSPLLVTLLAKAARRLARADADAALTVVEMLPAPDEAWLDDDRGHRHTSELRFVAVDKTAARTAPNPPAQEGRP